MKFLEVQIRTLLMLIDLDNVKNEVFSYIFNSLFKFKILELSTIEHML